jgi:hypothetical protein
MSEVYFDGISNTYILRKRKMKRYLSYLVLGTTVGLMSACGTDDSTVTSTVEDTGVTYNGAGSRWELIVNNDATCIIHEKDSNLNINASCDTLASGFTKITVDTATGAGAPAKGTVTYGVEVSGYMLPFVAFNEDKLVPTVIAGKCPKDDLRHNAIISYAKANSPTSDFDGWGAYGYWSTDSANGMLAAEIFDHYNNVNNSFNAPFPLLDSCTAGYVYIPDTGGGEITTAYFTESGGMIWHQEGTGTDERIENDFMLPYDDTVTMDNINGGYIGYVISGNGQTSYQNTPVDVTASAGTLTVKSVDPDTGVVDSAVHSTIVLNSEVTGTKGLYHGTITTTLADGIGCAVDRDAGSSGKDVMICGGMLPDGTLKNLYSVILVSK